MVICDCKTLEAYVENGVIKFRKVGEHHCEKIKA